MAAAMMPGLAALAGHHDDTTMPKFQPVFDRGRWSRMDFKDLSSRLCRRS